MKYLIVLALLVLSACRPIDDDWETPTPTRRVRPTAVQVFDPYPAPPLVTPVPGHYPEPPVEPTIDYTGWPTATPEP